MVGPVHRAVGQFVIERAGEDARGRGLADAAHAGEDPGLRDAAGLERIRDGAHHGVLADQVVEARRAVFARQHAIAGRRRRRRIGGRRRHSCGVAHRCHPPQRRGMRARCAIMEMGGRLTSDPNRAR